MTKSYEIPDYLLHRALVHVKHLIRTEDRWVKNTYAQRKDGIAVAVANKAAECFCLVGAIQKTTTSDIGTQYACFAKLQSITQERLIDFNDDPDRTFAEVHEVLDKAIEQTKES